MTQKYLNHLFENYTGVENFYWTADGTAFKSVEEARDYARILGNPSVKVLAMGGVLANALELDENNNPIIDPATGDHVVPAYNALTNSKLKELCATRNIALNGANVKADIISLLEAADAALAGDAGVVDYATLDFAQLQALCTEREIDMVDTDDDAALVAKLIEYDEMH